MKCLRWLPLLLVVCTPVWGAEIAAIPEGGWKVTGKTYTAQVDAAGGLTSVKTGGTELLAANSAKVVGAAFPGAKPATSVSLRGQMIAARNEAARVEYSFDDTGISIETDGGNWACQIDPQVKAFVSDDGSVRPGTVPSVGNVKRIIVGATAVEFSEPFHCMRGKLVPSSIPSGQKKPGDAFTFRIELGLSADATALIEVQRLEADGKDPKVAPWYKEGEKVRYVTELNNLGAKRREVVLAYTLGSHFVGGTVSEETVLPAVALEAGKSAKSEFEIAIKQPGVHWLNVELRIDGKAVKRERRAFVYAGENYRPALTRPADFRKFWDKQLQTLRDEPMKATLVEVAEKGTADVGYYSLTLTAKGKMYTMPLTAPRKKGSYMAVFGAKIGEKASDADRICVSLPHASWPDQATYTRWVSESDNNLMDCYLLAVRITDYLRSRPDVERIYLTGGSRQGAIQLVNAALDATKICATEPHVPTCMGISWADYAYKGWGKTPTPPAMAAYVDPVNFAPDMKVPFILDLGAYDGLSPVPGGLAFFNYATECPWKRFSVELGGHGFFTSGFKKKAKAELDELLKAPTGGATDDKVLKEH